MLSYTNTISTPALGYEPQQPWPKLPEHTDLQRPRLATWSETALHTWGTAPPSGNMRNRPQRPAAPGAPWRPEGKTTPVMRKPLSLESLVQSCMGSFSLCGLGMPDSKLPFPRRTSCLGVWLLLLRYSPGSPTPNIYTRGEKHTIHCVWPSQPCGSTLQSDGAGEGEKKLKTCSASFPAGL